jgi:CubicO group peptidase (beta-lactamase class C family)
VDAHETLHLACYARTQPGEAQRGFTAMEVDVSERFRLHLLVAATALMLATAETSARAAAIDTKLVAAVDAYLRPFVDLEVFQGVVLIARGDKVVLEKGYGFANVELEVRNTPARVFRIASLSKPFTEVALGRLVEEKRLALSDPLSRYIPDFPHGDKITLEMLRTHQAGIAHMNSIPFDEEASQPNTLDSLVRVLSRQPLAFEPGTKTRYSNGGYALLAHVIEKVTGRSYAEYLEQAVFRPLGLVNTRHEADQMLIPGRAFGYTVSPDERHRLIVPPFQQMATKTGGGSLVSTAGDLHRFLRAMYGDNAIQSGTWRTLFPPDSSFSYQGRCPGFNVYMARDFAHEVDVVVLCNNYAAGMVGTIGTDFLALARGLSVPTPRWRADLSVDSARTRAFTGTYRAAPGALPYGEGPFVVRWRNGDLVVYRDQTPGDVLIPQGNDTFLLRNFWSEMRFVSSKDGPTPTLRPLWFERDAVTLERVPEVPATK